MALRGAKSRGVGGARTPKTWREACAIAAREREKRGAVRFELTAEEWPAWLAAEFKARARDERRIARKAEETEVLGQELFLGAVIERAPQILEELAAVRDRVREDFLARRVLNKKAALTRAVQEWARSSPLDEVLWAVPLALATLELWERNLSAECSHSWALERDHLTLERDPATRPPPAGG